MATEVTVVDSRMELQCPNVGCILDEDGDRADGSIGGFASTKHSAAPTTPGSMSAGCPTTVMIPVVHPTLNRNILEDKYIQFTDFGRDIREVLRLPVRWRYETSCSQVELSEELGNLFGEELFAEVCRNAIVAKNNLVNIARLRSLVYSFSLDIF